MGRRVVQVCGAPTAIALGAERNENIFKPGCALQTADDNVVLRSGDNSLRVVDAQKFCAGTLDVRHVVQLPPNVMFSERNATGKFGAAWDNSGARAAYVVDFQAGEVAARPLPSMNEQIADAFVDAKGDRIAVVGATTGNLYAYSQSGCDCSESFETRSQFDWRIVDGTAIDTIGVDACSCGRFVSSAVMGDCFVYLRARRDSKGSLVVEKWIFAVDSRWAPVCFSSRALGALDSAEGLALFMADKWKFAIVTTESSLYYFQVDQDLRNTSVKRLALDHRILNGAWIDQDTAFAMLLANGQISIASVNDEGCFECLSISTTSTMSKRPSLSALLGKAVSAALQLVWVGQEQQLVVDFGTTCAAFKLEIVAEEASSEIADDPNKWTDLFTTGAFAKRSRQVLTGLDTKSSDIDECIRKLLKGKSSPSPNGLLDTAKIALSRTEDVFEDSYFMLLCIIHQQLAGDSVNNGNSRDPIDCIGKSLKLMQMLVSLTISMEAPMVRQISSRLLSALPGCATKSDRKKYYLKEIAAISLQVRKRLGGVSEREDWWVYSTEAAAFLRVYAQTIRGILHEIYPSVTQNPGEASHIISLCQRIIEHEDGLLVAGSIVKGERIKDPLVERLRGLVASYTLLCCYLHENGVMIDLQHIFSFSSPSFFKRKEMLCCFLRPWLRRIDDSRRTVPEPNDAVNQVVKFAAESDTLHLLVNFCTASKSIIAHSCVQELCKAAVIHVKPIEIETFSDDTLGNLHRQACEIYIGEAIAILQRIGARRQFKYSNREAVCIVERVSVGIGNDFADYYQSLFAEVAKTTAKNRVTSKKSSLWEFSHLDIWLRARVIFLISQIVWHLETASGDIGSLFQRAFVMNLFDTQLDTFSEEKEKLRDCITEVRASINSVESELRLPRFRLPKDVRSRLSLRAQTISRSLVLIAWALWHREKVANCTRGAHIGKMESTSSETKDFGALAATCALHLNSLGMVYGDNDELYTIQLSLLEDATAMNPTKAAAALAWGMPEQKIPTRHLKRYKGLRQVIQQSSMTMSLEESEIQNQQLQTYIRRSFQGNLQFEKLAHNNTNDIDVLVNCCCDPEVLQIMSVLAKCEVVATSNENSLRGTPVFEPRGDSHENTETLLPVRTEPEQTPIPTTDPVQISESLISRDEVIALLQAQTRHLEEKIHAVTTAGRSEEAQTKDIIQGKERGTSEVLPEKLDASRKTVVDLADVQKMARISLQVRDLSRHRYSSVNSEANKQANPLLKPAQRHDSVRNALKLFRLRQENCGHTTGETGESATANENGAPNVGNGVSCTSDTKTSHVTQTPAVSSRTDKQKRAGVRRTSSRNQRGSENHHVLAKEPVYPLRLEYGIDNASLKLLGRKANAQQRNPSVKRRHFVDQEREGPPKAHSPNPRALHASLDTTEVIQLKTVSAQTNDSIEIAVAPASAAKETNESANTQQNDIRPEKGSPMAQECEDKRSSVLVNMNNAQKGVGVQCRLNESGPTNDGRRKRSPPPLSIVDKYPVWVDLNGGSHFKEKKYLQVARFGDSNATDPTTNNDATDDSALIMMPPSVPTVLVPRKVISEDGSDENQSDGQRSPGGSTCSGHSREHDTAEQMGDAMKTKYRTRYREHYPVRERLNSKGSDGREAAGGINSLIDLRDNMQRMTQRLRVLETCANSIDEEFKISQKRLSRIGDSVSSRSRVLDGIDEVMEMTEEAGHQEGDSKPRRGLLSKKASSDMEAAKKLLEAIQQLTTSKDDQ